MMNKELVVSKQQRKEIILNMFKLSMDQEDQLRELYNEEIISHEEYIAQVVEREKTSWTFKIPYDEKQYAVESSEKVTYNELAKLLTRYCMAPAFKRSTDEASDLYRFEVRKTTNSSWQGIYYALKDSDIIPDAMIGTWGDWELIERLGAPTKSFMFTYDVKAVGSNVLLDMMRKIRQQGMEARIIKYTGYTTIESSNIFYHNENSIALLNTHCNEIEEYNNGVFFHDEKAYAEAIKQQKALEDEYALPEETVEEREQNIREYFCNSGLVNCQYRNPGCACSNPDILRQYEEVGGDVETFMCYKKYESHLKGGE